MKFTNPAINLSLFVGLSVALVARVSPKDAYADYEDVVVPGIPGVVSTLTLSEYKQLHYDNFQAVQELPVEELLVYPGGTGGALGNNGSYFTSQYNGSPVSYFKPNRASFACYFSDKSAVAPGVSCTVQVTAFHPDGTEYQNKASCFYTGSGKVQACNFPDTWTQVGKLSFKVITSTVLTIVGGAIGGLLGNLSPGLGTIRYIFDDFSSFYTCVAGKVNDAATGLCV
ncbi:hypothetical protein ACMFMG_000582 [Clarireedia jacksonii]